MAVFQARRQRLFHENVHAGRGRLDRRPGMKRVWRANEHGFGTALFDQLRKLGEGPNMVAPGERLAVCSIAVADGNEFRLGQARDALGLDLAHLAAAHQRSSNALHRLSPESRRSCILKVSP